MEEHPQVVLVSTGGGHIGSGGSSGSSGSGGSSGSSGGDFFDWLEIIGYSFYIVFYTASTFRYKTKLFISGVAFICLILTLGFGVGFDAHAKITNIQQSEQVVENSTTFPSTFTKIEYKETYTYEYTYYGKTYTYTKENNQHYVKSTNPNVVVYGIQTSPKDTQIHIGHSEKIFVQLFNPAKIKSGERIGFKLLAAFLGLLILVYVTTSLDEIHRKNVLKKVHNLTKANNIKRASNKCRGCGATVFLGDKSCPYCGWKLK